MIKKSYHNVEERRIVIRFSEDVFSENESKSLGDDDQASCSDIG